MLWYVNELKDKLMLNRKLAEAEIQLKGWAECWADIEHQKQLAADQVLLVLGKEKLDCGSGEILGAEASVTRLKVTGKT